MAVASRGEHTNRQKIGLIDRSKLFPMYGRGSKSFSREKVLTGECGSISGLKHKGAMELQQDELVFWTGFAAVRVCSLGSFGGVIRADGYGDLPVIFCRVIVYQRLKRSVSIRTPRKIGVFMTPNLKENAYLVVAHDEGQ